MAESNTANKSDLCEICGVKIEVMCFKGTGVCCELHRKVRVREISEEQARRESSNLDGGVGA